MKSLKLGRSFRMSAFAVVVCSILGRSSWSASTTVPSTSIAQSAATQPIQLASTQPADNTPLPSDPANIRGDFPNGLHYLIRKNANPPGKVYLNLAVRTGALNETDEQNGLAHFLEHMAFKGSTHYAPTRLIPMLEHLGMRFGADTNASTTRTQTVFKLVMPDTKPETIATGLNIFSDYANGLSLFPIQIESERRVILEEMRSRASITRREQKEEYSQLFPGSQLAIHDVIGDPEIIKNAKQPLFADYWNQWYRPENMTLIVVGDIDPNTIIAQAQPLLGTFTARAPAKPARDAGVELFDTDRAVVISDPEQVTGDVEVLSLQKVRPVVQDFGQYRRQMIGDIAQTIINRHINSYINSGKAPFQTARLSTGDFVHDAFLAAGRAQGEPAAWKRSLQMLIFEIKYPIERGITQWQWDTYRDELLSWHAEAVKRESTRDSQDLMTSLTAAVDINQPLLSSEQQYELLKAISADVTVKDLQDAFTENFANFNYAYVLKMPPPLAGESLPSEADVVKIATEEWKRPIETSAASTRPATTQVARSLPALPPDPLPGQVASRSLDTDLGVTTAVFENGVVMHHKFSAYKTDQVLVQILLPGGTIEEEDWNYGISAAASLIPNWPNTTHLTSGQINSLLADQNLTLNGGFSYDTLTLNFNAARADVRLGFQLERALLTDAKLDKTVLDKWKLSQSQSLRRKPMLADPQLADAYWETVMGSDGRFAPTTMKMLYRQDLPAVQRWFRRVAEHAAIEVTIVGDIPADDAVALAAQYLGSLPMRTGKFSDLDSQRQRTVPHGPFIKTVHYKSAQPKALVMAGFVGCDELDPDRRPLTIAAQILTERMTQHLRFEQQLVYSIYCTNSPGHAVNGDGLFSASSTTDPGNADSLADQILSLIKEFAAKGPTDDELATAKKEIANQLATQMVDPRFWLSQISELQYHRKSLDDLKQLPGIYNTYSATQVRDAVRRFATEDRLIRIEVLPDPQATTQETPTTQPGE